MKPTFSFLFRCLVRVTLLLVSFGLQGAPLAWFPGPSLDSAISGGATVVISGGNNLLIGGDSPDQSFPQSLAATNLYWTPLPSLGDLRIAGGAVVSGGLVILYGGNDGISSVNTVIGYSPSGDTPQVFASMSVARAQLGYAPDRNGNAYAIGGLDDNGQPLSSAERYDPDTDSWTPIASLPTPLYGFPAVFNRTNYIYIFGGRTNAADGTESQAVYRYSISGNTWTSLAPMPVAVAGSAAALGSDGEIYVAGGVSNGVATPLVQVYDPSANSWTVSTPLPESLSAGAMGVDSLGRLIFMGGQDSNGNDVSDVWRSQRLNAPDSLPGFVSYPATSATYQAPYTSSITATGNPPPLYSLVNGPAGMQVDLFTGVVTWTPGADQIGTNGVTLRATNYAGFVDWTFSIVVPNPPPTAPAHLVVTGVTDTSVTLSWDPESPVVGPATFSVYLRHVLHDPKGSGAVVWYTQIGSSTTVPTITLTGLTPGLSQTYFVAATAAGGTSGYAALSATTTAPQGPATLSVTELTSTTVGLAWPPAAGPAQNANYSPITSYTIMERKTAVSPAVSIPVVSNITGGAGIITGLAPGSSHTWYVAGVDAAGNASAIGTAYVVLTNPVPVPPHLSSAAMGSNGSFQFTASEGGAILQTVWIQASTNPADPNSWEQIGALLPAGNPFAFTDTNAANYPMRFYRLVAP